MKCLDIKMPSDFEEAYALLNSQKKATIIAGGLFLRLQKQTIPLLIDLSAMNLSYIKEIKDGFIIGPMTTLRTIETSNLPRALKDSVKQISGVGTRNLATIGGSICGRYPFSDIDNALMALNTYLVFYKSGKTSMRDYYHNGIEDKDILIEIVVPKPDFSMIKYYKKVYTDFSLVNVSLAGSDVAIGARPNRSLVVENIDFNLSAKMILEDVEFGTDFQASGAYRRALAEALLEDILKERKAFYGS